jgi:plasmid maintenance system antidote protein VapI
VTAEERFVELVHMAQGLACVRQYELAERIGVSPKHMNHLLKGKVRMTISQAERIADVLGYDLEVRFVLRPPRKAEPDLYEQGDERG